MSGYKKGVGHNLTGRSKGADKYVRLFHSLLNSKAWNGLTAVQKCVFLCLCKRFNGFNNGSIAASVRQVASEVPCNKDTVSKAFHVLEANGFIERVKEGGFSVKVRHAAEYRLTHLDAEIDGSVVRASFDYARQ